MISLNDKCLFVHIPKVAGQSIEAVFLQRAGLSWQQREAFLLRKNNNPLLGPPRLAHLTAAEYTHLGYIKPSEFEQFFKFSFVRNPWDRLVSEYLYRQYPCSFNDFLYQHFPTAESDNYSLGLDAYRHVIPQTDFLFDQEGRCLVDFIGKFENLAADFEKLTEQMLGQAVTLPHKNKTKQHWLKRLLKPQAKKQHYTHYYDEQSIAFVAEYYKSDIEKWGYQFGE